MRKELLGRKKKSLTNERISGSRGDAVKRRGERDMCSLKSQVAKFPHYFALFRVVPNLISCPKILDKKKSLG